MVIVALGELARLGLQPVADDAGALFAIGRPGFREAMVGVVVGFDTEGVLDDLGGELAVVGADCPLE